MQAQSVPWRISTFSAVHSLPMAGISADSLGRVLTSAGGRWDAYTDEVLEGDDASQKAAVLGPDLRDGFSSASIQDTDQPTGMNHGIEIHPLSNHIHRH